MYCVFSAALKSGAGLMRSGFSEMTSDTRLPHPDGTPQNVEDNHRGLAAVFDLARRNLMRNRQRHDVAAQIDQPLMKSGAFAILVTAS